MYTYQGEQLADFGFVLDAILAITETATTAVSVIKQDKDSKKLIKRAGQIQAEELAQKESLKDQEIALRTQLLSEKTQIEALESRNIRQLGLMGALIFVSVATVATLVIYKIGARS